jgi:hypothetical protein
MQTGYPMQIDSAHCHNRLCTYLQNSGECIALCTEINCTNADAASAGIATAKNHRSGTRTAGRDHSGDEGDMGHRKADRAMILAMAQ